MSDDSAHEGPISSSTSAGPKAISPASIRLLRQCLVTALALSSLATGPHLCARGRSFPKETTGRILRVFPASGDFVFQPDGSNRIVQIGIRVDCKYVENGVIVATGDVGARLRKGAHVKVSCFWTLFSGVLAVEIDSLDEP